MKRYDHFEFVVVLNGEVIEAISVVRHGQSFASFSIQNDSHANPLHRCSWRPIDYVSKIDLEGGR